MEQEFIHCTSQPDLIQRISDLIFHSDVLRQPGMIFQLKSVLRKIKNSCFCHFLCTLICPHLFASSHFLLVIVPPVYLQGHIRSPLYLPLVPTLIVIPLFKVQSLRPGYCVILRLDIPESVYQKIPAKCYQLTVNMSPEQIPLRNQKRLSVQNRSPAGFRQPGS